MLRKFHMVPDEIAVFTIAAIALLGLQSCSAILDSKSPGATVAGELSRQYIQMHNLYTTLDGNLPAEAQEELEKIAQPMDDVKDLLVSYNSVIIAGKRNPEQKMEIQAKIADLVQRIASIAVRYHYGDE